MGRGQGTKVTVATIGFAAGPAGDGVAYAAIRAAGGRAETLVRVRFSCRPLPALLGRNVAYAAAGAVAERLLELGERRVHLRIVDASLPEDLAQRRALPATLQMPYVALRCTLNRFVEAAVVACDDGTARDLTARAQAEVSLGVAA